jgi:hypothetical protein
MVGESKGVDWRMAEDLQHVSFRINSNFCRPGET